MSRCPPSGAMAEVEKSLAAHIYGEWHTNAEHDGSCSWTTRPELETPSKVYHKVSDKKRDDLKSPKSAQSKSSMSKYQAALFGVLEEREQVRNGPLSSPQAGQTVALLQNLDSYLPRQCFRLCFKL